MHAGIAHRDVPRGGAGEPVSTSLDTAQYDIPDGLGRADFRAMGTTISLVAPVRQLAVAERVVRGLFEEWEQALSRFRPESELSRVNALAGESTEVSPLLLTVLRTALLAAQATDGLFDPTVSGRMEQIGYDRDFAIIEPGVAAKLAQSIAPLGGWREVEVDAARRTVRLPRGVGLDFGGIAKGMAVDAAIHALTERGISPALVNGGGDLAVNGLPPGRATWALTVPGHGEEWVIGLERGALATSGIERRRWMQGALQRHHLLDPRTGEPAESGLWSVSAVAGTCGQAEVAAKVALILGSERGVEFIERIGLGALLVEMSGEWRVAGAWPVSGMRAVSPNNHTSGAEGRS